MSISFSGLASGLDTSSWVTSLTQLRQAKVTTLEEKKASIVTAQNTLSGIRTFFNNFRSTIEKITDSKFNISSSNIFSKKIATSSNLMALTATAKSNAAEGSYNVKINQTATQTQVKSGYRYKTQLVETTQAKTTSVLKNIGIGYGDDTSSGIKSGNIEITHNGVTHTIEVDKNETMERFLGKIHSKGIEAKFDNNTGIFSIGVGVGDINDVGHTGILSKLNIQNINYGYTGEKLSIVEEYEEYHQANEGTALSELGVHLGTFTVNTATGEYEVEIEEGETIGSLVSAMREMGIDATFSEGIFTLNNAEITDAGATDIINALGLTSVVMNQIQTSDGLKYQTVWTTTTQADESTLLKDINGVNLSGTQTINVKNADGEITPIEVNETTTIESLIGLMEDAGLSVDYVDGRLSISDGWIVGGGTFDVESAFGLTYSPIAANVTGDALTVTSITVTGATDTTKLGSLTTAVTSGNIDVTDTLGHVHHITIDENSSIGNFVQQIKNLGLEASFDNTTGVLTLVGGEYAAVGYNGTEASNILNVFFGTDTLDPSTIDSASSISGILKETITHTHNAEGTTTLGELGMNDGTFTATFVRSGTIDNGDIVTINISDSMKLNELKSALITNGINADFDETSGKFYISESEFVGVSGGNFDDIMNFTSTITGTYANSVDLQSQTVTTGREMTSAGVVNKMVEDTEVTIITETGTVAQASTGNPVTYDIVNYTPSSLVTVAQTVTSSPLTYTQTVITPTTGSDSSATPVGSYHTNGVAQTSATIHCNYTVTHSQTGAIFVEGDEFVRTENISAGLIGVQDEVAVSITSDLSETAGVNVTHGVGQTGAILNGDYTVTHSQTGVIFVEGDEFVRTENISAGLIGVQDEVAVSITSDLSETAGVNVTHGISQTGITLSGDYTVTRSQTSILHVAGTEFVRTENITIKAPCVDIESAISFTYDLSTTDTVSIEQTGNICSFGREAICSDSTTFADLGFTGNQTCTIETSSGTIITVTADMTFGELKYGINRAGVYVFTTGTNYYQITIGGNHGSGKDGYIVSMSDELSQILGISAGEDISYEEQVTYPDPNATLGSLGVVHNREICLDGYEIDSDGNFLDTHSVTLTYSQTDTLSDIVDDLSYYFYKVDYQDGLFQIKDGPSSANPNLQLHISSISAQLANLLGIEGTSDISTHYIKPGDCIKAFGYDDDDLTATLINADGNTMNVALDADGTFLSELQNKIGTWIGSVSATSDGNGNYRYTFTQDSDDGWAIQSLSDDLANLLGITVGEGYTYSNNSSSDLASDTTSLADLGLTADDEMTITTDTGTPITCTTATELGTLVQMLKGKGIYASLNNGVLTVGGNTDGYTGYITGISPALANALHISAGNGTSYQQTIVANEDTTMAQLGLENPGNITYFDGSSYVDVEINPDDTISNLIDNFPNGFITFSDGSFHIADNQNTWIQSIDLELYDILGISAGEGVSYGTTTVAPSGNATLESLGIHNNTTIVLEGHTLNSDGTYADTYSTTITFTNANKINDIVTQLGQYFSNVSYNENNGLFRIGVNPSSANPNLQLHISSISDELANLLGIEGTSDISTHYIKPGDCIKAFGYDDDDLTATLINADGDTTTVTLDADGTFLSELQDKIGDLIGSVSATPNAMGNYRYTFTQNSDSGWAIESLSPDLATLLNINVGEGYTYNYNSSGLVNEDTSLADLGLTASDAMEIVTDTGTPITFTTATKLGTLVETLKGNGIYASLNNGVLTVGGNTDGYTGYITDISPALANALGISAGNNTSYQRTDVANENTTMAQLGLENSGNITYFDGSSYVNVAINPEDRISDLIDKLPSIPITFNNGSLHVGNSSNTWIQSIDLELYDILGISAGEGVSYNSVFDPIEESTQLSELGLSAYTNYYIDFATGDGIGDNAKHIVVTGNDIIETLMDKIDDIEGCSTSLNNGIFTINHGDNWAVTDISPELANALHLNIGENHQVTITTHTVDENTTLEQLNMVGNSATIETDSNTITVHPTDTIGGINDALGEYYTLAVDESGCISLSAAEGHTIKNMSSNLANALGLEVGYGTSYNVYLQEGHYDTTTYTADNETTLAQLGLNHSTYIETDEDVFYINNTTSMEDLVNLITNDIHISASYNENTGIFTIGSDTDEHYVVNMSPELASILGNINVGNHFTYHITENETEEEHTTITYQSIIGSDTFSTLGVEGTNYITLGDGDSVTVTADTTFDDFVEDMNGKGFNVSLVNGIFNIQSNGNYIESDSNHILNKLNILGSTYTTTENTLGETKLKDLKDSEGNSLNISSGTINVVKNGISSTISINNNSKLGELANLLSNYNIQMDYGSGNSGHITFTGTGDSYLQELNTPGATNLLTKLGVTDWSKIKNSESEKLEYTTNDNETIKLSTKLVNLKDSDGNSMGVTEGKYRIVAEGIHYEGIVSSDTTVEDFFADLSAYGITGTIRSNGQIILNTSNDNTYLENSNGEAGYSSIVDNVFADWSFGNIYIANPVDVTTVETSNMTSETHLKDIDQGTFKAGKFVVASNLDGTTIPHDEDITPALDENATVGDFISAISYYGFNSYVENGRLIVRNDGTHTLENYNIPSQASNVISLLGLDTSAWEQPGVYTGEEQSTDIYHTAYVAATRETLLSELRDDENNELNITTGEYYVYQNGIKHTLNLNSTNISIDNFINTLSGFGINAVFDTNGTQSTLKLIGSGDSYLETSSAPNASNVVDKLFNNDKSTLYKYEHYQQTTELVTTTIVASLATMVSDYDTEGSVSAGTLEVYVDGNHSQINITEYETFGSLLEKFERIGVTATLNNGVIRLETGNTAFSIDTANSTSNLLTNLGLEYNENLGGFAASSAPVTQTVTIIEDRTLSVANYADGNTQIGLLNITSGSLSIYRNGQKGVVMIDNTEDFNALQTKIHSEFSDINIDFQDGKLRFYSTTEGVDVQVGSSSDSSNISSICGFSENENGDIISARELYKVNASSKITTAGIFRNGTVREGTFIVGDAEFNITSDTTIQNIVAQINSSDKSNASAYWDSVDGKLVIASRTTGAAMVNIEAGTSNFTDIIGLTQSEWNADNEVTSTRILRDSQEIGKNAQFTINGTSFSSSSNVISSDVSRIQGLTLNLKNATAGEEVVVQVEQDKEAVSEAMNEFVDSYNELVENLDKELSSTGALSDQNTLKFIKQQIRNLLTNSFGSGTTFTNLSSLGISTSGANAANAGSTSAANVQFLYFDADKFLEGYSKDAEAVKNMLVGTDATPGILLQIDGIVSNALATGTGYFSNAEKSYQQKISDINEKIKKANASIEAYRARLENKFQSMDLLISQMQNQYNSFLSGGMQSINTSSSGAISYF